MGLDYVTDCGWRLETREVQARFRVEFENGNEWSLGGTETYERLDDPFEIVEDVTVPAGGYRFREVRTNYRLGPQRRLSGFVNASWGGRDWVSLPHVRFTTTLAACGRAGPYRRAGGALRCRRCRNRRPEGTPSGSGNSLP